MFKFLMGVAFGAAGYWAWQSFGRDLLGMSGDQDTTYGGFSGGSSNTSFGSSGTGSSSYTPSNSTPSNSTPSTSSASSTSNDATKTPSGGTT
jgi:hypothetical protein